MKTILLFSFLLVSTFIKSQTAVVDQKPPVYNKYLIKIDSNIAYNISSTGTYIKQVCAANTINFNTTTKYFEVLTQRELVQTIIEGKLHKNLTPIVEFIFSGKVGSVSPVQTTTFSTQ